MHPKILVGDVSYGLSDLNSLPNIVRVVKSRRMRWTGHVARMGGGERGAQCSGEET